MIIRKLLLVKQSYTQLVVVMFGSLFGLLLVMSSLQLYFDFRNLLVNKEDLISPQFLVVNKPVNLINTISGNASTFSESDIAELRKLPSIKEVSKFKANHFKAQTSFEWMEHAMSTDMFFEAVPSHLLDVKVKEWQWKENDPVPIILPTDYINMYNFGFAPSQGLPQISKGMAKMAGLKIHVSGNGGETEFTGFIAGFTNRINSVLVPETFMDFANGKYAEKSDPGPSRLVLVSEDPTNPELAGFLEKKGYETNIELLKNSKLNALLKLILSLVLVIGAVIILLSVLGFMQYAQLLVNNSKYEIKTLLQLGYTHQDLFKRYLVFYIVLLGIIALLGAICIYTGKYYFNNFMLANGFEMDKNVFPEVIISGASLLLGFILVNSLNIFRMIKQLARPA